MYAVLFYIKMRNRKAGIFIEGFLQVILVCCVGYYRILRTYEFVSLSNNRGCNGLGKILFFMHLNEYFVLLKMEFLKSYMKEYRAVFFNTNIKYLFGSNRANNLEFI